MASSELGKLEASCHRRRLPPVWTAGPSPDPPPQAAAPRPAPTPRITSRRRGAPFASFSSAMDRVYGPAGAAREVGRSLDRDAHDLRPRDSPDGRRVADEPLSIEAHAAHRSLGADRHRGRGVAAALPVVRGDHGSRPQEAAERQRSAGSGTPRAPGASGAPRKRLAARRRPRGGSDQLPRRAPLSRRSGARGPGDPRPADPCRLRVGVLRSDRSLGRSKGGSSNSTRVGQRLQVRRDVVDLRGRCRSRRRPGPGCRSRRRRCRSRRSPAGSGSCWCRCGSSAPGGPRFAATAS